MEKTQIALSKAKKYYIEKSMERLGQEEFKKALQSLAITVLFLENNIDEKNVLRDGRNMLYDMLKNIKSKEGKKMLKQMIKLIS